MNTRVNPRTFTDHIPAYLEKRGFLLSVGRPDLADTHDYFFYKRLLLFYNQIKKETISDKKKYLKEITDVIYKSIEQNKDRYEQIYRCSVANPNEKKKMDLFLKSPHLYWFVMQINEAVVLPLKRRRSGAGQA